MTITSSTNWLSRARSEGWAIGAYNANTLEQIEAIVWAAQEELSPVIVQFSHRAIQYIGDGNSSIGIRFAGEIGRIAGQLVEVPVTVHLDHGTESEICQAIELGFTSVMFDGSLLPYSENLQISKELCKFAHDAGIHFEAELGSVSKTMDSGVKSTNDLTNPNCVEEFVEKTQVDSLAISIGSEHGIKDQRVNLNLDLLETIGKIVKVPLVLHGASGVTDVNLCKGIELGLSKINIATHVNLAFTTAIRNYIITNPEEIDPRKYLVLARKSMKEQVRARMKMFGSTGRYLGS